MKQCSYQNGSVRCKTWVVEDNDLCPIHAGVVRMQEPRKLTGEEAFRQRRFEECERTCDVMSNEELQAHILQLESLLEDVKLRQQVAQHVRSKRVKELIGKGQLTETQLAEISKLRDPRTKVVTPKLSPEEKEIQKLVQKYGFTRENAMKLLGIEESN